MRYEGANTLLTRTHSWCRVLLTDFWHKRESTASRKGANSNGRLFEIARSFRPFFPKFSQFDQVTHLSLAMWSYNHCQKCREGYFFVYLFSFFLSLLAKCWIMRSICFPVISQNWIGGRGGGYLAKETIPSSSHYTCKPFYWTRRGIFRGLPSKPFSELSEVNLVHPLKLRPQLLKRWIGSVYCYSYVIKRPCMFLSEIILL